MAVKAFLFADAGHIGVCFDGEDDDHPVSIAFDFGDHNFHAHLTLAAAETIRDELARVIDMVPAQADLLGAGE